jgi:hypothetical protein
MDGEWGLTSEKSKAVSSENKIVREELSGSAGE